MIREIRTGSDESILNEEFTKGLGELSFYHPEGTFALTPASNIEDKEELDKFLGKVNFIVANPPSSDWDDGFGFRRIVLKGGKEFLTENGIILLNISFQYGMERVEHYIKT